MRKPASNIEKKIVAKILENVPDNQFTPIPYYYELLDSVRDSASGIICTESQSCIDFVLYSVIRDALSELVTDDVGSSADIATPVVYLHQSESQCQTIAATLNRHLPWLATNSLNNLAYILVTTPALLHSNLMKEAATADSIVGNRLVVLENAELYADSGTEDCRIIRELLNWAKPTQFVGSSAGLLQGLTGAQGPCLSDLIAGLKATFRCPVTFASDVLSALIYGGQPDEEVLDCPSPDDAFGLYTCMRQLLQSHLDWLMDLDQEFTVSPPRCPEAKQFCIKALRQCLNGLDNLGPWGCNVIARVCLKHLVSLEQELLLEADQLARCLVRSTVTRLAMLQKRFHAVQEQFADVDDFRRCVPPNVHRLLELLARFRPRTEFSIEFINESFGCGGATNSNKPSSAAAGDSELVGLSDAESTDSDEDDGRGGGVEITELNNSNCLPYKVVPKVSDDEPTERLSALVFVRDCFTAYGLCKLLEEVCIWDPEFFFVKPAYMFSLVTKPKQQRVTDYLRKFRQGEANLLVVTEAMENLGDLPKCNLVVRFNPPRTFNSYFHSKNRARSFNSTYATIVTPCDAGFQESHAAFKATEELLLRSGAASDESRRRLARGDDSPIADADDESSESETFAPFGLSGPSVTADAAIPVVNRYCARLPSDVFASLVPLWQIEKSAGGDAYRCRLCLPMNSPCRRSVIGAWCPTVQSAKCSAALACVRELHSAGQLDSNLKPYSKEELVNLAHKSIIQSPMSILSNGDGVISNSNTGIGGSKRRQVYQKQLAAELTANLPEPDLPCRLYRIRLRPEHVWAMPSAAVAAATDPEQLMTTSRCRSSFGLILRDPLPDCLPLFCLYPRQGETDVDFPLIADSLTLSAEQLSLLKRFHRVLFHRVLRLEKEASMTPDFDEAPFKPLVCLLTRPVKEAGDDQNDEDTVNADDEASWQLDWDLAGRVVASAESQSGDAPPCEILPEKPFKFRVEDFNDCVIVPSYRNFDQPQFYFVSQIRWDLNPASPFPTSAYDSFEEYYLKKYNIRLTTRDQPLLDVEQSSSRYNVLTPRFLDTDGRPLGTRIKQQQQQQHPVQQQPTLRCTKDEQQKQLFIPELCYRHIVPASVWRQACCLPSALYRLNHLLLAESLRHQISQSTGVGIDALNTISSGEKLAYCALINSSSVAAQQQGQATADDKNAKSAAPGGDANFGVFQCNSADNDEDPLLGEAGDGEDAESTDSFEEMVTFFPSVRLAVSLLPSSADLLQCLTASNAGDLMNLERLETVGDSLLKFAVTVSLYCTNPGLHEGGLTQLRSRQVSNSHLYLCAAAKGLGELIVANKFEPRENWLPPGLVLKQQQQQASKIADSKPAESLAVEAGASTSPSNSPGGQAPQKRNKKRSGARNRGKGKSAGSRGGGQLGGSRQQQQQQQQQMLQGAGPASSSAASLSGIPGASANCTFLQMEQSLTDKCLADSVEAIVGCYLVRCNEQAALRVCRWFGIAVGELGGNTGDDVAWPTPPDPVLPSAVATSASIEAELARRLTGYDEFESLIGYRFRNRAYLLQAFTHPSDYRNDLTDCYQRLEFLGDAVLDYVVTRYLFHDSRRHSPAVLTDLRSALVNNDIFGALAVKWGFHKYFRCVSPALHSLIDQFVQFQKDDKADNLDFVTSEEADFDDRPEDVEIPKCLGDIFESVAGAVFLDSGMSLDTVWRVFYPLMKERIECYTAEIPKSLVRELLETEPDCTKFEQPTRTASGTIRVVVHVIGKGRFAGVGRNYRIARNSAAKVALRYIKAKEREKSAASAD
ncbi:hypothetical protein BOX15_Mlig011615g1, partial [Macrostomum lignano]